MTSNRLAVTPFFGEFVDGSLRIAARIEKVEHNLTGIVAGGLLTLESRAKFARAFSSICGQVCGADGVRDGCRVAVAIGVSVVVDGAGVSVAGMVAVICMAVAVGFDGVAAQRLTT